MPNLFVVFVIGLFGSTHCVGMCGGFVLALSQMHGRSRRLQMHQFLYFSGKTLTYTLLGNVAGGFGAALGATSRACRTSSASRWGWCSSCWGSASSGCCGVSRGGHAGAPCTA